jgi:fatty acid-binding protein DegV
MIQQMKKAEVDGSLPRYLGHSDAMDKLTQFQTMVQEETGMPFPTIFPIGITVGTHAGPGCVGLCYFKK